MLLTELDVLSKVQAKERLEALFESKPINEILVRQEEDRAEARRL